MKKIILLFSITLLFSCSNSDNDNINNYSITPPSWIHGTWAIVYTTDPVVIQPAFKFKSNDFCVISSSTELCQATSLEQAAQSGANVLVEQTITDTEYELKMTILSQTTTYNFIKINDTKIEYVNPTIGLPNTPLYKQ
jgi:hypothetical protein